jgi:hypothetical protein
MAEPLRYPLKRIDKSDDYLRILIVDYVPPGLSTNAENLVQRNSSEALKSPEALAKNGSLQKPLYQILLPMPQGISDTNMVDWGDDSLNPFVAAGVGASQEAIKGNVGNAIKNITSALKNVATNGNGQDLAMSYFSAQALNTVNANVSAESLISRSTGQVLNPNMELLFKGVQLRTFNFSFNMAPREQREAMAVKNIIRTFKKSMAAKNTTGGAGAGLFISSPNIFQLEYRSGNKKHPFLNTFKPCALLNMAVDYTASGAYSTYEDATPVHMKLTLTFQELNPVYFNDYDGLTDKDGVGY